MSHGQELETQTGQEVRLQRPSSNNGGFDAFGITLKISKDEEGRENDEKKSKKWRPPAGLNGLNSRDGERIPDRSHNVGQSKRYVAHE